MVESEFYKTRIDGVNIYRTYSTEKMKLMQDDTGQLYGWEVYDVENIGHVYSETNIKDEDEEPAADQAEKAAAYDIIVGNEGGEQDDAT